MFPLFLSHIDFAHQYWERFVQSGDTVIDATCGNGHDTLLLAKLVGVNGIVHAFDVQEEAINNTKERLGCLCSQVQFHCGCHSCIPAEIERPRLIVYNLGYLPGGDKGLTTKVSTTLLSVESAMEKVVHGGVVSITCYPGHEEGAREEELLLNMFVSVDPSKWSVSHQRWVNRSLSPSVILLQRQ